MNAKKILAGYIIIYCLVIYVVIASNKRKNNQQIDPNEKRAMLQKFEKHKKLFRKMQKMIHKDNDFKKSLTVSEWMRLVEENNDILQIMSENAYVDGKKINMNN